MAGFFGLFNYDKEGPGIDKNAPKKHGFIVFFETFFRNFWKFITINLVFVAVSAPVATHGLAFAGLTNVTRNIARDKHSFGLSDFFETIKKNWKQALPVGIINTALSAVIYFAVRFYAESYIETKSMVSLAGFAVALSIATMFLMLNFYIWTLMITFDFKLKALYSNSFKFVLVNLKKNILCGLCLLFVYALYAAVFILFPYPMVLGTELLLLIFTLPAFRFLLIQYFVFPAIKKHIIDPYYKEHPDADIDKRRALGIEVETQSNDQSDFSDELIDEQ